MDVIDDILRTLNLQGALYFRTEFSGSWSVEVPTYNDAARFHMVVEGECFVQMPDGSSVTLRAGDMILIPRGSSHILADQKTFQAPDLEQVLTQSGYDGAGVLVVNGGKEPGSQTRMVCGHYSFRDHADHVLLRAFPDYLIISASDRARNPMLDDVLRLVVHRVFEGGVGTFAAVSRLSEIVLIEILKSASDLDPKIAKVLAAYKDDNLSRAMSAIHHRSSFPWTVELLASEAGMSRSRFSEKFSEMIGQSPMSYLSDWRLQKALTLLDAKNTSVQEVASEAGYLSSAAFTRAFSGKFGFSPSEYRRAAI